MSNENQSKQTNLVLSQSAAKSSRTIKLFRRLSKVFEATNAASKIVDFLLLVVSIEPIRRVFDHLSIS
jgi:hypothetical protein